MPLVGFEHTIPAFERAKTVCALERAAGHCDRHIWMYFVFVAVGMGTDFNFEKCHLSSSHSFVLFHHCQWFVDATRGVVQPLLW
jgi:hypothetical protein